MTTLLSRLRGSTFPVLLAVGLAVSSPSLNAAEPLSGTVNDVVTARVVAITVDAGEAKVGTICAVKRDGKTVGKVRLKTATGICEVLEGDVQTGDRIEALTGAAATAVTATETPTETPATTTLPRGEVDPSLKPLLEAQGMLALARFRYKSLEASLRGPLKELDEEAATLGDRLNFAARILRTKDLKERVAESLRDAGFTDVAQAVTPPRAKDDAPLSPLLPTDLEADARLAMNAYGECRMLDAQPLDWMTPTFWGRPPAAPKFSGWEFDGDTVTLAEGAEGLIRTDFELDDVEVRGEVKLTSGAFLYILLRRDIVVKFELPDGGDGQGTVALKFGYSNLRLSDSRVQDPALKPGSWVGFRANLQGRHIRVWLGDNKVLDTQVTSGSQELATVGSVGLGAYRASGAFRGLRVEALSDAGRRAMPLFDAAPRYVNEGKEVTLLTSDPSKFAALAHHKMEAYQSGQHAVKDGTLTITGSPFAQFTHKDIEGDHFKVRGQLRLETRGSVWLRANRYLLFGLKGSGDNDGEGDGLLVKHSTGDFRYGDETFPGPQLTLNRWYNFELVFHNPVGWLSLDGKPTMLGIGARPETETKEIPGPNQFGVSAYGARVLVKDLAFQRLAQDRRDRDPDRVRRMFRQGKTLAEAAIKHLNGLQDPSAGVARDVLASQRPAILATIAEVNTVAETFKAAGDWTTYLAVLEANFQRLPNGAPGRDAAEKVWNLERQKFEIALETVANGEIGLDNVVRVGEVAGPLATEVDGRYVWVTDESGHLHRFDPVAQRMTLHLDPSAKIRKLVARPGYLIAAADAGDQLYRIELPQDGKASIDLQRPKRKDLKLARGTVVAMAPHPRLPITYVAVNENERENKMHFDQCRIYVLNEADMTVKATDAIGMDVAVDPAGRYLYTGFAVRLSMGLDFNPGPVNPQPIGPFVDHLLTYQIDGQDLVAVNDRAAPGSVGLDIVPDPRGRGVIYLPANGFRVDSNRNLTGAKVPFFRSTDIHRTLGAFDTGVGAQAAAFHPYWPVVYIAVMNEIRAYDAASYELQRTYSLPAAAREAQVSSMAISPDGGELLVAWNGRSSGVFVLRLEAPATVAVAASATDRSGDPAAMLKQALALDPGTPRAQRLGEIADAYRFTPIGEDAAKAYLNEIKSPFTATDMPAFPIPVVDWKDLPELPTAETVSFTPAARSRGAHLDRKDPQHGDKPAFREAVEDLESFDVSARTLPWSWLYMCQRLQDTYPDSPRLHLLAAKHSLADGRLPAAARLGATVLSSVDDSSWYACMAWLLLADVSKQTGLQQQRLTALDKALQLQPWNAFVHRDFGDACAENGMVNRAARHRLIALNLFPSQPTLRASLQKDGLIPPANDAPEQEIGDLFRQLSPSVVLVKRASGAGTGTGWFIGRDGLLLTNYHVIGDESTIEVVLDEGDTEHSLPATILAIDSRRDMALLQVDLGEIPIVPLPIAEPGLADTGDRVLVIGNPGMGAAILTKTVTEGIISNTKRLIAGQRYVQTSAAVNPGNSGGPMFNRRGQVIGMVTLKASLDNVGFAIPSDVLLDFVEHSLR